MQQTDAALRQYYGTFNKHYFNGALPTGKGLDIGWVKRDRNGDEAWCYPSENPVRVRLNAGLIVTVSQAAMALLHEMAHIAVYMQGHKQAKHGPYFQMEMLRLAMAGAFRIYW